MFRRLSTSYVPTAPFFAATATAGFSSTAPLQAAKKPSASLLRFNKCVDVVDLKHDHKLFEPMPAPPELSMGEKLFLQCPEVKQTTAYTEVPKMVESAAEKLLHNELGSGGFSHLSRSAKGAITLHNRKKLSANAAETRGEVVGEVVQCAGEVEEFLIALIDAANQKPRPKIKTIKGVKKESDVDIMSLKWLTLSRFGRGGAKITGSDKRTFSYRGVKGVAAIPDCVVVETSSGEVILIVEDKAGVVTQRDGYLGQLYAEMLCCLWNKIQNKNYNDDKKVSAFGIRVLNHHVSFYRLDATVKQVKDVCDRKTLPRNFTKMTLWSETMAPDHTTTSATNASVAEIDHLGRSLLRLTERREAQAFMSKLGFNVIRTK